jgi:pimeloyl-ACP methyl ester carboxylesterase
MKKIVALRFAGMFCLGLVVLLFGCGSDAQSVERKTADSREQTDGPPRGDSTEPNRDTDTGPDESDDTEDSSHSEDDSEDTDDNESSGAKLTPVFKPSAENFYSMPWPSDFRVNDRGGIDLTDLPNQDSALLGKYVDEIESIKGFSLMPVIYTQFGRPLPTPNKILPSPQDTVEAGATVQLINVSDKNCGTRIPLRLEFDDEGDRFMASNLLKATPVPGFPLQPGNTYALVITNKFGAGEEIDIERPNGFHKAFKNKQGPNRLHTSFRPLRTCLNTAGVPLKPSDLAVATVFTTQSPVAKTRALVEKARSDSIREPKLEFFERWETYSTEGRTVYRGRYQTPIFQHGPSPYSDNGGGLEFNIRKEPIVARWEDVPFTITIPNNPSAPLDVIVWEGGTGFNLSTPQTADYLEKAVDQGFAVATFTPQFHHGFSEDFNDKRGPAGGEARLHSFNFLNPTAGRTVFRQQVADTSYFTRVIRQAIEQKSPIPDLVTDEFHYGGHSQGALVGAMVAGSDPKFDSFALNGIGGYLSEMVLERKIRFGGGSRQKVARMIESTLSLERQLDHHHIVTQLLQLGGDVVDPANYIRNWRGFPADESGVDVFISNGRKDATTTVLQMNAILMAGNIPAVADPGWEVDEYNLWNMQPVSMPVSGNVTARDETSRTQAAFLNKGTGHFTLQRYNGMASAYANFWATAAGNSTAEININQ